MSDNFGRFFVNAIVAGLVGRIANVIRTEIARAKQEITDKLKGIGAGIGVLVAASAVAFFLLGVLIAAGILGLATVWPAWLAALTVAGGLLLIVIILIAVGVNLINKNKDLTPQQSIDNIKAVLPLVD